MEVIVRTICRFFRESGIILQPFLVLGLELRGFDLGYARIPVIPGEYALHRMDLMHPDFDHENPIDCSDRSKGCRPGLTTDQGTKRWEFGTAKSRWQQIDTTSDSYEGIDNSIRWLAVGPSNRG